MIEWKSAPLARDFREFLVHRLSLPLNAYRTTEGVVDFDSYGVNPEIRFLEEPEKRLVIDVLPITNGKSLAGLRDYVHNFIRTERAFREGTLAFMSSRREFPKYSDRLAYHDVVPASGLQQDANCPVSVCYRVQPHLLALNQQSFRETVYDYALMPLLDWAQRK